MKQTKCHTTFHTCKTSTPSAKSEILAAAKKIQQDAIPFGFSSTRLAVLQSAQ